MAGQYAVALCIGPRAAVDVPRTECQRGAGGSCQNGAADSESRDLEPRHRMSIRPTPGMMRLAIGKVGVESAIDQNFRHLGLGLQPDLLRQER
jgi:hypothetical protein